jgi:hypothetical protein
MRYPMNRQMVSQQKPSAVFAALQNVLEQMDIPFAFNDQPHTLTVDLGDLVFEADIVKIPRLNMYGVHFRRLKVFSHPPA